MDGRLSRHLRLVFLALVVLCLGWWRLLILGQVPVDGQVIGLSFPIWALMRGVWSHPRLLLWNPAWNLGQPFAADPRTMALYPLMWLLSLAGDFPGFIRLWVVAHTMLAAGFMALLVRRWYGSVPVCAAAAIIAGLNGFFTARVTCPNHFASAAWLPAILYFQAEESALGLAFCLALQWLAGFPPFFLLSVLAALGLAIHDGGKGLRCWLKACVLGAGLSAVGWIPFLEMLTHSVRTLVLSPHDAAQFSIPLGQLLREVFVPEWYFFDPRVEGDPAMVVFYAGVAAIALAAWGAAKGKRESRIGIAAAGAFALSLGEHLPGYRFAPFLHIFRFPANWLLLAASGVGILAAAGISGIRSERRQWLCVVLIAAELLLFSQFKRVAWAFPEFFSAPPVLAQQMARQGVFSPARVYHTKRLMDAWKRSFLESEQDYSLMRQFLAPSFGTAFGVQEVASDHTLLLKTADVVQRRLAPEPPGSSWLNLVGAALVVDLSDPAQEARPASLRLTRNPGALPRVFMDEPGGRGRVESLDYQPGRVVALCRTAVPAQIVLSENDYPGWSIFMDGRRVGNARFQGAFPSALVPVGRHEVLFVFRSLSFAAGLLISLASAAFLLGRAAVTRSPVRS